MKTLEKHSRLLASTTGSVKTGGKSMHNSASRKCPSALVHPVYSPNFVLILIALESFFAGMIVSSLL